MELGEVDTLQDLTLWIHSNMPGARIIEGESEIEIHTGLMSTMGGYLHPVEREGKI